MKWFDGNRWAVAHMIYMRTMLNAAAVANNDEHNLSANVYQLLSLEVFVIAHCFGTGRRLAGDSEVGRKM